MFRIRQEHLGEFEAHRKKHFLREVSHELSPKYPQIRGMCSDEQWQEKIEKYIEKCLSYGLNTKGTIVKFIELSFSLGEGFEFDESYIWALKILQNKKLDAKDKFFCLLNTYHAQPTPYKLDDPYSSF